MSEMMNEMVLLFETHRAFFIALLCFALFLFVTFLFPILFHSKLEKIKYHPYKSVFLSPDFYKLPIRWLGLFFIFVYSLFSKKGKLYLTEALKGYYDEESFDSGLLISIAQIPSYRISLFLINTIHYFQAVRHKKNFQEQYRSFCFFEILKLHAEHYRLKPEQPRLILFEQKRFDFFKRIPTKSYREFMSKLREQLYVRREILENQQRK